MRRVVRVDRRRGVAADACGVFGPSPQTHTSRERWNLSDMRRHPRHERGLPASQVGVMWRDDGACPRNLRGFLFPRVRRTSRGVTSAAATPSPGEGSVPHQVRSEMAGWARTQQQRCRGRSGAVGPGTMLPHPQPSAPDSLIAASSTQHAPVPGGAGPPQHASASGLDVGVAPGCGAGTFGFDMATSSKRAAAIATSLPKTSVSAVGRSQPRHWREPTAAGAALAVACLHVRFCGAAIDLCELRRVRGARTEARGRPRRPSTTMAPSACSGDDSNGRQPQHSPRRRSTYRAAGAAHPIQ